MEYVRPRSGFQTCDTFIENDYRAHTEMQAILEHDKLVARERQYELANQLSRITCAEFRDDVLQQMLEMDVSCSAHFETQVLRDDGLFPDMFCFS
jgi:hypothetical protein